MHANYLILNVPDSSILRRSISHSIRSYPKNEKYLFLKMSIVLHISHYINYVFIVLIPLIGKPFMLGH